MQLKPQVHFSALISLCAVDKGSRARQRSEAWSLVQQVDIGMHAQEQQRGGISLRCPLERVEGKH